MKIAVVSHSCVVDVNQQLFAAMNNLPDTQVALLVPANWTNEYSGKPMTPHFLPDVSFPVFSLPVIKPGHISFHAYKKLPLKAWKAWRPDAILAQQEPWSLSCLQAQYMARTLKIPWAFQTNQNIFKKYPPPFGSFEQASYKNAHAALAYSEEARQVMIKKGLHIPSFVVPYATDVAQFQPMTAAEKHAFRASLGLPVGAFVVGFLGRFVPEKGVDTLIEAIALVKQARPGADVRGLFVGAGAMEADLKQLAQNQGVADALVWTGLVPHKNVAPYMAALDVFALPSRTTPSWKEQFGRVIIEALASGVPVVGSDSGQIPHLIQDTGGGLVFPEGDAQSLAAQIIALIDDPALRQNLTNTGAKAVQERFTCEAVAQKLRDVFTTAGAGA